MSCPQIYLGTGRAAAPLADDYANDSIVPPTYYVQSGTLIFVQVNVYNHGTDPAPPTDLELYWTTPGTFVAPVNLINTYSFADGEITGAVSIPPTEGSAQHTFAWTPSTIGHFCLFARLRNTMNPAGACLPQSYGAYAPPDDPLSGIHNVEVITGVGHNAPPPRRGRPMWFAFAAGNSFHGIEDTKLTVRVLDPGQRSRKTSNAW